MPENLLQKKRIVITGASSGVGRATAKLLAQMGAQVVVMARRLEKLEEVVQEITALGGVALAIAADTSDYSTVKQAFAEVDAKMGGVDILVNCAGLPVKSIFNTPPETWEKIIQTNLVGYMYCTKEAVELMRKQGAGQVLNIGSLTIRVIDNGCDIYTAAKVGVAGFTNSLRKELAGENIVVTLINPGQIASGMVTESPEEKSEAVAKFEMLKPEDVAETILYCLNQPDRVVITEVEVRPRQQVGL